jgi:signal transduction histidine kinase
MLRMAFRAASDRFIWVWPVLTAMVLSALAAGVAAAEQGRVPQQRALDPLGIALLLAGSATVAVPKRWSVPTYLVALVSVSAYQALGYTIQSPYFLGVLLTGYRAAEQGHRRRTALLALLGFPLGAIGAVVSARPELAYGLPTLAVAALVSGQVASELRAASVQRELQARSEHERLLVSEERLRIARELHDVISHGIATIGVQAGVAAHVLDQHPEQAREALLAIKAVSRDAMRDLRGMLGVLHETADGASSREPAPGLASLPELIDRVRSTGVEVRLEVTGQPVSLTPATDLAAYRVVQEALTNVLRHAAPAACAQVRVAYGPTRLQVEVVDDGGATPNTSVDAARGNDTGNGTGHGLSGLHDRVAALGGRLQAGPTAGRGFCVAVSLPAAPDYSE